MKVLGVMATLGVMAVTGACSLGASEQPAGYSDYLAEPLEYVPNPQPKCDSIKSAAYSYAGLGKKTPEAMVKFLAAEFDVAFRSRDGREVEVNAFDLDTGDLARVYRVSRDGDLWYPDGYATCAQK